jgi:GTPase
MAPEHVLKNSISEFTRLVTAPGVNKTPYMINNIQDVINCCRNISSGVIVPMIRVSNVTAENLDLLKMLFNCLPSRVCYHEQLGKPAKYTIQEVFQVPGIGAVVSGILLSGVVSVKSTLWLGPDRTGRYQRVAVKSIHDKKMEVSNAFAGQNVCFALRGVVRGQIRKGMYLIDGRESEPPAMREFTAEIEIFGRHSTSIKTGYEPVVHVGNVRQTAVITDITNVVKKTTVGEDSVREDSVKDDRKKNEVILRAGDRATVTFRFKFSPVYLESNAKILFREGRTRGVGLITTTK